MSLTPGTRLGPYEVTVPLGVGGMGAVYRARDTKLQRDVALKVLLPEVANDPERLARFRREAQVLASLNHPHIGAIHGLEESDGTIALVLELVEGPTLADRIGPGAIPLDEALAIARQIAEALEAAHEQGIIHRDLKPANIKVRDDGTVKVLDFGLAKALDADSVTSAGENSPTITSPAQMTRVGMILGTAAYMAPEQARGRAVDRRADLWAFGCVLFEMLTGRRAFDGEDVAEVLSRVLLREPDPAALPAATPAPIRRLLRRCLEKDRKRRLDSAAAARLEIEEALAPGARPAVDEALVDARVEAAVTAARAQFGRVMRTRLALVAAAALLAVGAAVVGVWLAMRPAPPRVVQTTIATTPATAVATSSLGRAVAITPDGTRVVYTGDVGRTVFVRPLDSLDPITLYTGAPRAPFISPDGQWVGFGETATSLTVLKKVAISGGPAATITALDAPSRGAVWLPDDTIVFATTAAGTGLQQVGAGGGAVTVLTRPDRAKAEADHLWPEALPGGRAVLFTILPTMGGPDAAQIAVLDLVTRRQTVVLRGGSHAQYVARPSMGEGPALSAGPGPAGYLVYGAGGTLRAVAFDLATRTTQGTPVPVVPEVVTTRTAPAGGVEAAVAADGTLAYVRGVAGAGAQRALAWVDRQGRETALTAPPRLYFHPRVSPDGGRLAVWAGDQDNDLWVWDLVRETLTRLTFAPLLDAFPVWAPDGRRLFFSSFRDGAPNLQTQAADGTGTAERLTMSPNPQWATGVTPDGTRLLFFEISPQSGADLLQVSVTWPHAVTPLVQTPATERNGVVSPDGRWLAYEANDSGAFEIYVRPYPDVARGRWQVSTGGGTQPLWARDGRELFYLSPANALMRVGVARTATWTPTTPARLLGDGAVLTLSGFVGRQYDVSPDGQRFLILKEANGPDAAPPQLIVVQHFDELLSRLVPRKE